MMKYGRAACKPWPYKEWFVLSLTGELWAADKGTWEGSRWAGFLGTTKGGWAASSNPGSRTSSRLFALCTACVVDPKPVANPTLMVSPSVPAVFGNQVDCPLLQEALATSSQVSQGLQCL